MTQLARLGIRPVVVVVAVVSGMSASCRVANVDARVPCLAQEDPSVCDAAGDALADSRLPEDMLEAVDDYGRACKLRGGACPRLDRFAKRLTEACTDQVDDYACNLAALVTDGSPAGTLTGMSTPHAPAALALHERACDLGGGFCRFVSGDWARDRPRLETQCIDGGFESAGCLLLRANLILKPGLQRNADDWLPLLSEAAVQAADSGAFCEMQPNPCEPALPRPPRPPPEQAAAERKRIVDTHAARCKSGELSECEAQTRIVAFRFAESLTADRKNEGGLSVDTRDDWNRLCRAGDRAACLIYGLLANDEATLQHACELGDALGCTRAAGAVHRRHTEHDKDVLHACRHPSDDCPSTRGTPLSAKERADARAWLDRACRLGRTWACGGG